MSGTGDNAQDHTTAPTIPGAQPAEAAGGGGSSPTDHGDPNPPSNPTGTG